ncbi:hypothetical protein HAP41_0000006010 [Bradyrhizobium barranii subsp. apii]|uniref:Uncharacterized protein n=1 Tax=Bradyrhizobium barranii subsp. apii TaxID=2819348 RepID=A0A8T5VUQ0_9BRAD|nr:hypothetical protein [Bradyrhizobium barranii]UPT88634.1 hypothetical protein HAP41_0000006010 [Bradyrhizobium barranii subsp. apii]
MTKIEKQLEQARADLAASNEGMAALGAQKAEAIRSSKTYAQWRLSYEEFSLEGERLGQLVEKLEADLEREKADAKRSALDSRKAELQKQTAALARRINEEGSRAAAVLVALAEEARANAEAVERLNRELSDHEHLIHADHLARHRAPAPRENLAEAIVDLWTFEVGGELVGDPDLVVERSYERGIIPAIGASLRHTPVVRKRFKQITYREQGDREYAVPLASVLKLPRFDAPGMLFDHGRAVEPAQRRELVELIPAPDAPAKPADSEAA